MTRPAFESSLAALRDNVVMAIERREMGVVQDGLDVYLRLLETVLDEQIRLQTTNTNESYSNTPLGLEWDQILRDLHGVIDSVSASTSRLLWVDVLSWVSRAAVACTDRGILNALGTVLTLFESAWGQELASPGQDALARQDALLLRLSEFGRFSLTFGRSSERAGPGAIVIYTRTFLRVIKQAIESGDLEAAQVAIKYFLHARAVPGSSLEPVTGAGLLALYAWILYRFDHGEQDASFTEICAQISRAFERDDAFVQILRESDLLERELGIHWWELRERGPMSSGVIQIGTYITLALMLVAGPRLNWLPLDPSDEDDLGVARRLLSVIDSIEKGSFGGATAIMGVAENQFDGLKSRLSSVVEQGDAIAEETHSRAPIDPLRVGKFRSGVQEKLREERSRSLTLALLTPSSEEEAPAASNFGLDTLIPRWYFAETHVSAEPERLAEDLVNALVRGEEDRILELTIADLANSSETTLDSLRAELDAAIMSDSWTASPVVVTNNYQAHALLTGRGGDTPETPSERFATNSALRVYDDRPPYVALLSPEGIPRVQLPPPATSVEGDELDGDLAVIIGVSELSPTEIEDVVSREVRSRIDEARLRGSLRIRLLERLEISIEGGSRALIWRLPESSL